MPAWLEGIPTVLGLFVAALILAAGALVLARGLGLQRLAADRAGQPRTDPAVLVERLASFADVARREGLLSLESRIDVRREPLVACAIALAIEGANTGQIQETLDQEIQLRAGRGSPWSRFSGSLVVHVPTVLVLTGASLLLITLITHAQNPAGAEVLTAGAAMLLLLIGVTLTGSAPLLVAHSAAHPGAAVLSALLQSTGSLLICSGADGRAVRAALLRLLPGQTGGTGQIARAA
jgi:chemotaxis protein MotA